MRAQLFVPHLPSLASYHLKCHTSSPTALHSALYLRMGTPPVASGSSNCTCAVLEYGSTWSMDGEDGVSVGRAHGDEGESNLVQVTTHNHEAHLLFLFTLRILLPVSCPPSPPHNTILSEHAPCPDAQASIPLLPDHLALPSLTLFFPLS